MDQGLEYYKKFLNAYPTVSDLAQADEQEVLRLWQGLGYYSRARNLHKTAQIIEKNYNSIFPDSYSELLKLKGVGSYTAGAIASFAYNERVPIVDGNVFRVLSRIFGVFTDIASSPAQKEFREIAQEILPDKDPATHNQAIMEFGALQCTPKNPDCETCPFQEQCYAFAHGKQGELPVKKKKVKVRDRYFNYLVLEQNGKLLMQKREKKDIWEGLYDFPLIETKTPLEGLESLMAHDDFPKELIKNHLAFKDVSKTYKHILSHQRIWATFWTISFEGNWESAGDFLSKKESEQVPKPILIDNFLGELN